MEFIFIFALMKVYFYHTQDIQRIMREWGEGRFPGHYLYGATQLGDHGIDVVFHRYRPLLLSRWRLILYNTWQILTCREHFDAIYATHYRGIEIIIFLRAIGLFRRPIVIWHHQPMVTAANRLRRSVSRLFYRGIDHMFFFSEKLIGDSLASPNARPERMHLGHWGPDIDFFKRLQREHPAGRRCGFISTGKERRDMPTLVKAFNDTGAPLSVYLPESNDISYRRLFDRLDVKDNIQVNFVSGMIPYELSQKVNRASCVVICCKETKYTVGLTTIVEALGLGLPVICSRNPQFPIDVDKEGCGISVPYYDVEGWRQAIAYIMEHPDEAARMGRRAREIAETRYNDTICAREAAEVLRNLGYRKNA